MREQLPQKIRIITLFAFIFLFFALIFTGKEVSAAPAGAGAKEFTGKRDFKWPVPSAKGLSSCFKDGRSHDALDIAGAAENADVVASYAGTVCEVGYGGGYGNYVIIEHTNYKLKDGSTKTLYSKYNHLYRYDVKTGQKVTAGQRIGGVGSTGATAVHLDFQIMTGKNWNNYNYHNISKDPYINELLELPSNIYVASTNTCCGVGPTACCCKQYLDYVKTIYAGNPYHDPQGHVDSATASDGKITVSGWAFDLDVPTTAIGVHVYVGGPVGSSGAERHALTANKSRPDVAKAYASSNIGNSHGFSDTFTTAKSGTQDLYFYAINAAGGTTNPYIGKKTVTIPKDSTKPTISDVQVTNISSSGYTVTCKVSDNVGVTTVKFPTWTARSAAASEQDDLIWHVGKISGNTASFTVKTSDHKNEKDINYVTHIYAYDAAGNVAYSPLNGIYIDGTPPVVYDVKLSNASKSGFDISGKVSDRSGLDRVEVQAWTKLNGQDDLTGFNRDVLANVNGNSFTCRINTSDHNNELGPYYVHLWVRDKFENYLKYRIGAHLDEGYGYPIAKKAEFNGHTYLLINDVQFWTEAATYCQSVGGYLVTISSKEENDFVAKMVSEFGASCWLGATDQEIEGTFVWDNGEAFQYTNWAPNQPDNKNSQGVPQDYVRMYPAGTWDDVEEPIKYAFICEIDKADNSLSNCSFAMGLNEYIYDGTEKYPEYIELVSNHGNGDVLKEGTDYTVSYESNINAGAAKVIISGIGNYSGTIERNFTIEKTSQWISASIGVDKIHVGDEFSISTSGIGDITYSSDNRDIADIDATGKISAKSIGQAMISVVASGDENHESATAYLTIVVEDKKTDISDCNITIDEDDIIYDGEEKTPLVTVKDGAKELILNDDFILTYKDNVDAGTATVTIEGVGDYEGKIDKTYIIRKAEQDAIAFTEQTTIKVGETLQVITESQGETSFNSANSNIASISNSGLITGLKEGTTTIKVVFAETLNYKSSSVDLQITVEKQEEKEEDHTHSYTYSVTTPASCESEGIGTYTCDGCGNTFTRTIPAIGHKWSDGVETTAPTCTHDGVITYTCATCGAKRTEDVPATGHVEITDEAVEATCARDPSNRRRSGRMDQEPSR